jgi:tyrosine-protein phosphatase non-receptor type 4
MFAGSHLLALQFRVKFYVPDPSHLQEELTCYFFYLQIKNDIFSGRLPCSFESAALLGSYMVQAELGDYSPRKHQQGYVSELQLFPGQTEDLEEKIAQFHREHSGKTTQEAEFLLLANAKRLEFYGVELFPAKDHHGIDLSLGITTDGIAVFKSRTIITTFLWIDIRKITFKRRRFFIELRPNQDTGEQNAVGFHMDSYDGCKQLWKDCIDYHAFFRTAETNAKGFMKRSKKRFSRTERQVMDESKPLALKRSASVRIKRVPPKRQPRRPVGTNLGVQGGGGASMGGIPRRNHSFNMYDITQKPQVTIRANGCRDMSDEPDDRFDDYPPLSLSQQAITVSDDMTGQFTLAALEEEQYPVTHRRVSDLAEQGPTDYYDDQVKQEEEIGNVCMDDLASEGLLLIRLEADERGRYGFNVKGGVDQKLPVLVSKVSPQSPAEKSNPPLEEGDQLLYINSKPVSHSRHEEVISMIRASRDKTPMELILIVKPKDLSRTNPIVRTQTTESATSDPGQLLRQSLTYLKESLSNSMGLLQFDRLYRRKPGMAAIASKLPQNLVKNRYRDISAYDATRVHLREGPDYINANFVNLEVETTGQIVSYIASQGPMQHTCKDFWQMVWEQSCELVIMLTEVVENGKVGKQTPGVLLVCPERI